MKEKLIVSKINEYLHLATKELSTWLEKMLPRVTDEWWRECVLSNMSFAQRKYTVESGYTALDQLDLAVLLGVLDYRRAETSSIEKTTKSRYYNALVHEAYADR